MACERCGGSGVTGRDHDRRCADAGYDDGIDSGFNQRLQERQEAFGRARVDSNLLDDPRGPTPFDSGAEEARR